MRTVFQITTQDISERVKADDVDFVVRDLEKNTEFYLSKLIEEIVKFKNYNRGDLTVGMLVKYEDDIYEVTEVTQSAATIESLNTGDKQRISVSSFIPIV